MADAIVPGHEPLSDFLQCHATETITQARIDACYKQTITKGGAANGPSPDRSGGSQQSLLKASLSQQKHMLPTTPGTQRAPLQKLKVSFARPTVREQCPLFLADSVSKASCHCQSAAPINTAVRHLVKELWQARSLGWLVWIWGPYYISSHLSMWVPLAQAGNSVSNLAHEARQSLEQTAAEQTVPKRTLTSLTAKSTTRAAVPWTQKRTLTRLWATPTNRAAVTLTQGALSLELQRSRQHHGQKTLFAFTRVQHRTVRKLWTGAQDAYASLRFQANTKQVHSELWQVRAVTTDLLNEHQLKSEH
ncbi:hypothetical protein ABBQ38_012687 [Trebouxia sp. C0009 RCD-2024]